MNINGLIFIGDILDQELYDEYEKFRSNNPLSFKHDLYLPKAFFVSLPKYINYINRVEITKKIGVYHNELTEYRYDVLLYIDKKYTGNCKKIKHRYAQNIYNPNNQLSLEKVLTIFDNR
ncbi:hypothetical protein, partial [Serratia marcescens]|uniref:hypothetical protein n=1 Tax=Serratia marcescens TaxID=615 RepID=UPI001CA34349